MGVRPLEPADLPALAELHVEVYGTFTATPEVIRRGYVERWPALSADSAGSDAVSPSLVFELDGAIVGYVLVGRQPAVFRDERIWVASTSHLTVHPDARASLAAIHLMRAIAAGPQDLTYIDRSNETGRQALRAAGFEQVPAYSLRWEKQLRPGRRFARRLALRLPRGSDAVIGAVARSEDSLPNVLRRRALAELPPAPEVLQTESLTIDHVVVAGPRLLERFELHSDVSDRETIAAQWRLLEAARPQSRFVRRALVSRRGDVVGWYIVDIDDIGFAEVIEFASLPQQHRAAKLVMLHDLMEHDVVITQGNLHPENLYDTDSLGGTVITEHATTSVSARDDALLEAFRRNRASLNAVEGEFLIDPTAAVER